jgi:hypothetical protein
MSNEFFVVMRTRAESQEEYLPFPKTLTGKREVESGKSIHNIKTRLLTDSINKPFINQGWPGLTVIKFAPKTSLIKCLPKVMTVRDSPPIFSCT